MYKLPQLPHDQFAAFVCALFNQLLDDDFILNENGKLIESASGEVVIFAVPLPIEQFQKEAIENLKIKVDEFTSSKNERYKKFIVVTNYALDLDFQDYLDKLKLREECIYLDWESISILVDGTATKLDFQNFYTKKDLQKIPHGFKTNNDVNDVIDYYQKGIIQKCRILGEESRDVIFFRMKLAEIYKREKQSLESLKEYKILVDVLQKKINFENKIFDNAYSASCTSIGVIYYELGDYITGLRWFENLLPFTLKVHSYKDVFWINTMIGLMTGYLNIGDRISLLNLYGAIEEVLFEKNTPIPVERLITLYLGGIRVYYNEGDKKKGLEYFRILWDILGNKENLNLIDSSIINKEFLEQEFPTFYEGLTNQDNLIKATSSKYLMNKDTQLPFAIKQVHIKAFQSIKDLKIDMIPVDAQWIFITGKNGSGKSSILKAITAGVVGDIIQEHIRPSTEQDCIISIELLQDNTNQIQTLKSEDRRWELYKDKELGVRNIPLLAYGVSRLNIQTEESEDRRYKEDNVFSLFRSDEGNLSNVEEWLKDEMLKFLKAKVKKDKIKIEKQYKMVKEALSELMPSVSRVDYNDKEAQIEYTENGEVVRMERLASGNKSILAMIGDILIRLLRFYPDAEETADFKGIIIIDELDLHLHPSWQREMPWLLSKLFPKVQFICSTHSIIPFMGAPKNSVFFTVDRTEEEGTTIRKLDIDVSNLSANILLSSPLFEVSLLSKVAEEEGKSQEYRTESDYKEYNKNVEESKEFKNLQKKYGDILGDKLFKK
jgi:predicted ATP-binding protein involved in virulence